MAVDKQPTTTLVQASAAGFISQTKRVKLFCGADLVVEFGRDQAERGTIVGTVSDGDTTAPAATS